MLISPLSTSGLTVGSVEGCNVSTGVTALVLLARVRESQLIMAPSIPPKYTAVQIILVKTTPTHISKLNKITCIHMRFSSGFI